MSVKNSAHLKLPLDADDKFETSSTTLELDVKPGDGDGLIAAVQTTESVSWLTEFQNYQDDRPRGYKTRVHSQTQNKAQ